MWNHKFTFDLMMIHPKLFSVLLMVLTILNDRSLVRELARITTNIAA